MTHEEAVILKDYVAYRFPDMVNDTNFWIDIYGTFGFKIHLLQYRVAKFKEAYKNIPNKHWLLIWVIALIANIVCVFLWPEWICLNGVAILVCIKNIIECTQ